MEETIFATFSHLFHVGGEGLWSNLTLLMYIDYCFFCFAAMVFALLVYEFTILWIYGFEVMRTPYSEKKKAHTKTFIQFLMNKLRPKLQDEWNSRSKEEIETELKLEKKVTLLESILNNLRILEVIKNRRNHYRRRIGSTLSDI